MHTIFVISAVIGFLGFLGFSYENITGRMTRFTRWKDMTSRQWLFCCAMLQFAAEIAIMVLYHAAKEFA